MSEDERVGSPVNNRQVVDLRDDLAIGQWKPRIERPTCLEIVARWFGMRVDDHAVLRQLLGRVVQFRIKRRSGRNWTNHYRKVLTISIDAKVWRQPK